MNRGNRGFTLVEVLIALAIFAFSAIMLGSSYLNVLQGYEAANLAVERNEDLEFVRATLMTESEREVVERGGEFDGGNSRRISWKAEIEETETPDVFLVALECVITAPSMKKPEVTRQRFRLLRPTWAKADERDVLRGKLRDRINKVVTTQR